MAPTAITSRPFSPATGRVKTAIPSTASFCSHEVSAAQQGRPRQGQPWSGQPPRTTRQSACGRPTAVGPLWYIGRMTVEAMFEQIRGLCAQVRDRHLKALLFAFLDDPEIAPAFLRAPAAMRIHHARPGGLCEHTLSVLQLGWRICDHYPRLDRDLVTAGCLLHDIGKVREISPEPGFDYTQEGKLVGHLVLTCQWIREKALKLPGFLQELEGGVSPLMGPPHLPRGLGSPQTPASPDVAAGHASAQAGTWRDTC